MTQHVSPDILVSNAVVSDALVVGGGIAGIVAALELLRAGNTVTLVDRDTAKRFGGLARWAFGGMALIDTPLQRSMKITDSPERALRDWIRFGELDESDKHSLAWAKYYVEHSCSEVHDWLKNEGIKFMPAVVPEVQIISSIYFAVINCWILILAFSKADVDLALSACEAR